MSAAREKSRTGRIVVHTVWWSIAGYAVVAVFASVALSLYGRPPKHDGPEVAYERRQRAWCLTSVTGLRDDLDAQVTLELTRPEVKGEPLQRFRRWESEWRSTFEAAEAQCTAELDPELGEAYHRLRALYETYAEGLAQLTRGRITVTRAFEQSVEQIKKSR